MHERQQSFCKYTMMRQSDTTKLIMFIIVLGQHVSILTESSSGPTKKVHPYFAMFKNAL